MFRRLLLKLTLLNASVIAILFLALIAGAYFYAQYEIGRHSVFFLTRVAEDINTGRTPPFLPRPPSSTVQPSDSAKPPSPATPEKKLMPPPPIMVGLLGGPPPPQPRDDSGPGLVVFYVQTDADDKIVFSSSHQSLSDDQVKALVETVQGSPAPHGRIFFADAQYFYLATPRWDQSGTLFIFQNFDREYSIFQTIMNALAMIGVVCFIASIGGSLFLARRAMQPIHKAWDRQRDFLADASHELRTPLAVIQASLDVMRCNADEQVSEQEHWMSNMGESVTAMANLVDSLLFLARIDSSQHPIAKKSFALDNAVAAELDLFKPLADAKGIHLFTALDSGIKLMGDEARIKQVLGIILDNAIRHTQTGGKIEVLLQQYHHNAQLTISDNGEGIPKEHLGKIFERFYQVNPARNKEGSGLGLSIAKCIIESHQGSIQAMNNPPSGATFLIRIPLSKSNS